MTLDPVRLQTLVLARAQTSSKPMTVAAIAKDLERFAPASGAEWKEAVAAAVAALQAERVLDDKRRVLDRDALGKRLEGSGKRKWQPIVERLIPALGLGMAGKDAFPGGKKKIFDGRDGWAAAIAGRALSLWTAGPPPSAAAMLDRLVWQRLGLPGTPKRLPDEVRAHFLQLELDTTPSPSDRLLRILAARELGVQPTGLKVWRNVLGQRWLTRRELGGEKTTAAVPTAAAALPSFLDDVLHAAANLQGTARVGSRKVFLAAAWDSLRELPAWSALSLEAFKERMLDAHRNSRVALARADFVGSMDASLVNRSETISAAGGTFHFLVLPDALVPGDAF